MRSGPRRSASFVPDTTTLSSSYPLASGAAIPQPTAPAVLLEGDGIAAVCAARLLTDAGIPCVSDRTQRPRVAAILLGQQTQHLLRELFPACSASPDDLFAGFSRIERRIVLWGDAASPVDLPHRGVVVPEDELLRRLWSRVPPIRTLIPGQSSPAPYTLRSTSTPASTGQERPFGTRTGRIALVDLHDDAEPESCWVESVGPGWLFLLSLGGGRASLIAVGDTVQQLLAASRLIAARIRVIESETPPMPVFPRLREPLAGSGEIACGSAAMSFDPLCGEGAGHALREGFLAAAVIRSALTGTDPELLAAHYTARLRQGMLRHLQTCLPFYTTGGSGDFWLHEADSLRQGIALLQAELSHLPAPRFQLIDCDLVPI